MNENLEERRTGYSEMKMDIALIKQKIEFLVEKIESIAENQIPRRQFEDHIISDRWMFGIIVTLVVGVIVKLFQ